MRLFRFILAVVVLGLFPASGVLAANPLIENDHLALGLDKGGLTLYPKQAAGFALKQIVLPGKMTTHAVEDVQSPLWGKGRQVVARCDDGCRVTMALYEGQRFLHIAATICNPGKDTLVLKRGEILSLVVDTPAPLARLNALGSGGLQPAPKAQGSYTYALLAEPESRNAVMAAWLTQHRGVGTFMPKVTGNEYRMTAEIEYGRLAVAPGAERETDVLLVGFFADGRDGLELYADLVVKSHNITLPAKPNAYCTWYHRNSSGSGASTEKLLAENALFAKENLAPYGLDVMQIDDQWQDPKLEGMTDKEARAKGLLGVGPIKIFEDANYRFPRGMAHTADVMRQNGFIPGIWFMPFAGDAFSPCFDQRIFARRADDGKPYTAVKWSGTCIDATSPYGEAFLRERITKIYDWGYRYFKIDGLHTGAPSENLYVARAYTGEPSYGDAVLHNPEMTFTECFRKGLSIVREQAPEAFVLGCNTTQNQSSFGPSFGLLDAMRVGPDNDSGREGVWKNVTKGADFAGNLYFLNNKVWYNDPDPYYVRESNPLEKARWMVSWQSVSGAMSTTSIQYADLPPERLELIRRGLPAHSLPARPADILESRNPRIWLVGNERMSVIGLFNWQEDKPAQIRYTFERMGLEAGGTYVLFDFWGDKLVGTHTHSLDMDIEAGSCRVLAARTVKTYPQVISTSRHITQGLMDILSEEWDSRRKVLSGESEVVAGDRYELRVVVPEGFRIREAKCDSKPMKATVEGTLLRVEYTPAASGRVQWRLQF